MKREFWKYRLAKNGNEFIIETDEQDRCPICKNNSEPSTKARDIAWDIQVGGRLEYIDDENGFVQAVQSALDSEWNEACDTIAAKLETIYKDATNGMQLVSKGYAGMVRSLKRGG